jgi:hypothetical protein
MKNQRFFSDNIKDKGMAEENVYFGLEDRTFFN